MMSLPKYAATAGSPPDSAMQWAAVKTTCGDTSVPVQKIRPLEVTSATTSGSPVATSAPTTGAV
jgi:hypothetical protein